MTSGTTTNGTRTRTTPASVTSSLQDDSARHTKWMKFMYPRLQLMKQMLKPAGVLAICIDHRELFHLGQMLDELFGEQNRLAIINWQKSTRRGATAHVVHRDRVRPRLREGRGAGRRPALPAREKMDCAVPEPRTAIRGSVEVRRLYPGKARRTRRMVYGIQIPFTGEIHYPPEGKLLAMQRREMKSCRSRSGASTYVERDLKDDARRSKARWMPASRRAPA